MLVTDDVSHADTSPVKLDEKANMEAMLVTNDVSQFPRSSSKPSKPRKRLSKLVTWETHQLPMGNPYLSVAIVVPKVLSC